MIFHRINPFLAINKLRHSAYLCTPSGIPKLKLWLGLLIPKLFSYPYRKARDVKKLRNARKEEKNKRDVKKID